MLPLLTLLTAITLAGQSLPILPGEGSSVEAVVEKTGLLRGKKHILSWSSFTGRYTVAPPGAEISVDAASVQVLDDWLNTEKRAAVRDETVGKNVLDTARFPRIEFRSASVSGDPAASFQLTGTLTILGIAKPVTLSIRRTPAGFEGETRFPMSAFGIKPPRAALGAVGTKDEVLLRFRVAAKP